MSHIFSKCSYCVHQFVYLQGELHEKRTGGCLLFKCKQFSNKQKKGTKQKKYILQSQGKTVAHKNSKTVLQQTFKSRKGK